MGKINKVVDFSINAENPTILGIFPRIQFKDKGSYEESGTKQFDRMAFKYLGIALFPLALAYCIYSVIYNEHKSWYSFILSSCYGFLLTFGFIMMTPQLFINYKLKSVAHLPWRMMTYKALNTFIDDIFALSLKCQLCIDWAVSGTILYFSYSFTKNTSTRWTTPGSMNLDTLGI